MDQKREFEPMLIEYEVINARGEVVHSGSFQYADYQERRAFAERGHQAWRDGFQMNTWRSRNE